MEAITAIESEALAEGVEEGSPTAIVEPPVLQLVTADDDEPALDLDREAFELAHMSAASGSAALPLPRLPRIALPEVAWGELARRTFDVVAASLLVLVLAPLLVAIAIAIRLDSRGPVLFRQRRLGKDAEPFTIRKFRTMRDGADARVHEEYMRRQLTNGDHAAVGDNGQQIFKPWPDHRVTRVGAFLRSWSLDELPQLINVLRGEMTLVGFRPPIEYEVECYPEWYYGRFAVKPGITGLWQTSGRNEKSYEEMVRLDIEYVERRSWMLDVKLLLRTLAVVVKRHGAY
jgi:lipopolysaccharide/colanic/teichoic acid biosynthesis glycosyltransferase